jgi:two-component system NarL family response regulator
MRVLIVDDHRLFAEGVSNLLAARGIEVAGIAADGLDAVAQVRARHPDLVLMDIAMPRCNGLAATRLIKAHYPDVRIVMLTTSAEDDDLFESIKSGACGYLLKSIGGREFIDALRGLEEGVPPFSPGLAARLLREFVHLGEASPGPGGREAGEALPGRAEVGLTERQSEVLKLVAAGLTYKEAGARLGLSERTVRYHMAEIMDRLHLEHRSQVIAYAGRQHLE